MRHVTKRLLLPCTLQSPPHVHRCRLDLAARGAPALSSMQVPWSAHGCSRQKAPRERWEPPCRQQPNAELPKWKPVTGAVTQGSVLGPIPLNISAAQHGHRDGKAPNTCPGAGGGQRSALPSPLPLLPFKTRRHLFFLPANYYALKGI